MELLQFEDKVHKPLLFMLSELKVKISDLHLTTALNYWEVWGDSKMYCAVCYENRTNLKLLLGLHLSTIIESDAWMQNTFFQIKENNLHILIFVILVFVNSYQLCTAINKQLFCPNEKLYLLWNILHMSSFYTINYSKTIHKFAYITAYATPSIEVCGKILTDLKRSRILSPDKISSL